MLLHTDTFAHKSFHTQTLFNTNTFTDRRFSTQTLLHTDALTHRCFYTQTLLHTDAFDFDTQILLHTKAFRHRCFYTQTLLHTFTHRHLHTHPAAFHTQTPHYCRQTCFFPSNARWLSPGRLSKAFTRTLLLFFSNMADVARLGPYKHKQ